MLAALNRIPELVEHGRRAGSDLGYVVTRRFAFASDVPPSYVEFVSEMLAQTPLEVIADFYVCRTGRVQGLSGAQPGPHRGDRRPERPLHAGDAH